MAKAVLREKETYLNTKSQKPNNKRENKLKEIAT